MKQGTTADVVNFEMLFNATPDLYLILDPTLRIVTVNEAYLQATLTTREQLMGKPLFEIFPDNPNDSKATGVTNLRDSLQIVLQQKTAHTMAVQHYDIRRSDGTFEQRFWSPKNVPVFDKDNNICYIIHRVEDVTAFIQSKDPNLTYEKSITIDRMGLDIFQRAQEIQKTNKLLQEKDESLRLLTDEAKEQNRRLKMSNQLLEEFAYTVSHDLQEPLRMIGGFVDLLKRRYQGKIDEKADHYIYYIVDGVERMQNLISDLLTYSRLSNAEKAFEVVTMDKSLAWAISNLQVLIASTKAQVHYQKMPTIFGNSTQMGQLLQNLIANAIHYRRKDIDPVIDITVEEQEHRWLFKVKDNGIGIPEEHRERIFKLFQRLNAVEAEPYKGTGLGLSLCKRIIQNHNGDIWIESDGKQSSTFLFTLPKHEGASS